MTDRIHEHFYDTCPRCGEMSLEYFTTYDYCFHCGYSCEGSLESDQYDQVPSWAIEAYKRLERDIDEFARKPTDSASEAPITATCCPGGVRT